MVVAEVLIVGCVVPDTVNEDAQLTVAVPDVVQLTLPKDTTAGVLVPLGVCVRDADGAMVAVWFTVVRALPVPLIVRLMVHVSDAVRVMVGTLVPDEVKLPLARSLSVGLLDGVYISMPVREIIHVSVTLLVVVAVGATVGVRVRLQLGVTVPVGVAEAVIVGCVIPDTVNEDVRLTVAVPEVVQLTLPEGTTAGVLVPLGVCVRDADGLMVAVIVTVVRALTVPLIVLLMVHVSDAVRVTVGTLVADEDKPPLARSLSVGLLEGVYVGMPVREVIRVSVTLLMVVAVRATVGVPVS